MTSRVAAAGDKELRVCLVTQWFPPEPVQLPIWIAEALQRRDCDVSVLTGVPNYPDGVVLEGFSPWTHLLEEVRGLRVQRSPLFPSHSRSASGRIFNYVSWALSASWFGRAPTRDCDVSLVYSSPATAALPALIGKMRHGTPYVLMIQDLWPDSIFASGFIATGWVRKAVENIANSYVRLVYRHAGHITVISPGMRDVLVRRGVAEDKLSLVFNWVDESVFRPCDEDRSVRSDLGLEDDDFVLMYAGNHGGAQGLRTAIEAFGRIPPDARCHLVLVGDGVEKENLVELAARVAPRSVHFLPACPFESMASVMAAAEVQLVSLVDDPLYHITMPSKVQSILACGRPVIVAAPGDAGRVVQEANAGIAVQPGHPEDLRDAVLQLRAMQRHKLQGLGENGYLYYRRQMSEAVGAERLVSVIRELAEQERAMKEML